MATQDETRHARWLDPAFWRIPLALAICALAMAWTAFAHPDVGDAFPGRILDALGFLLSALVFALGFAQQALKRTLDDAYVEARRREDAVLVAATSGASPMTTVEVCEQAALQESDCNSASSQLRRFGPGLTALARTFGRSRELENERSWLVARLSVSKADHTSKRMDLLRRDFEAVDKEWRSVTSTFGIRGHMAVSGIAAEGGGVAFEAVSIGYVFVIAMWGLVATGALLSAPAKLLAPSVDLWIVLTIIGLAHVYISLIHWDMKMSLSRFEHRLRALPISELFIAERLLGQSGVGHLDALTPTPEENASLDVTWSNEVSWRLDRYAPYLQALPWFQSLRGRQHLWTALRTDSLNDRMGALGAARHYLSDASRVDRSPITLLALARTLEEIAKNFSSEPSIELEQVVELSSEAATQFSVEPFQLTLLRRDEYAPPLFVAGQNYARMFVAYQQWCWPTSPEIRRQVRESLAGWIPAT